MTYMLMIIVMFLASEAKSDDLPGFNSIVKRLKEQTESRKPATLYTGDKNKEFHEGKSPVEKRDVDAFVVGGEVLTDIPPYMATIQYWDATNTEWVHTCGGALIEPGRVVTAAHCMVYWGANASHGLTSYRVGLGYGDLTKGTDNPGSQTYTVTRVRRYYSYQFKTSDDPLHMKPRRDDLAMLSLSQNAEMTSSVSTIEVQKERIPDDYQLCYQFGWGGTETKGPFEEVAASNSLKKMVTVHIPNHVCRKLWGVADNNVYESQVCSWTWGVVDSSRKGNWCWLDNGGPMVCDNKLVGISNIGDPKCAGCFPEICTRLSYYNRWIRRVSQMP